MLAPGLYRRCPFAGPHLTIEGLRHVHVGLLEQQARARVRGLGHGVRRDPPRWRSSGRGRGRGIDRVADAEQALARTKNSSQQRALQTIIDQERADAEVSRWALADLVDGFQPPPKPGGPRRTNVELADAAQTYVERCVKGGEKARHGRQVVRPQPVDVLDAARRGPVRWLLTGNPARGQVVGALTPKARTVLKQASQQAERF